MTSQPPPAKRTKHTGTASALAVTHDVALLEKILRFVPVGDPSGDIIAPATLRAVATLCRAIPGLGKHLGPENEAFWRKMVLASFDFTTDPRVFNRRDRDTDEDDSVEEESDPEDDEGDDEDDELYFDCHRHPLNGPLDEWESDHPGEARPRQVLWHGMRYWSTLRIFFRSGTYEFLSEIQRDMKLLSTHWQDEEDAYSLFRDLVLVTRLERRDEHPTTTPSADDEEEGDMVRIARPCLMGRLPVSITGRGFAMLRFCDIAPHYWTATQSFWRALTQPVSDRWSGFDVCLCGGKNFCTPCKAVKGVDEAWLFPSLGGGVDPSHKLSDLREFVRDRFSDWRRVSVVDTPNNAPHFHIGKTKRSGRWLGFVDQLEPCE